MYYDPNRRFLGNYLSKRQAGGFLTKSLISTVRSVKRVLAKFLDELCLKKQLLDETQT